MRIDMTQFASHSIKMFTRSMQTQILTLMNPQYHAIQNNINLSMHGGLQYVTDA